MFTLTKHMVFAGKHTVPKVPLRVLWVATEVLDLMSYGFYAIGIEDLGVSHTDIQHGVTMLMAC